jgi:hypothetical protein
MTCEDYVNNNPLVFVEFYSDQGGVIEYTMSEDKKNLGTQVISANPGVFFYFTGLSEFISAGAVYIVQTSSKNSTKNEGLFFSPVKNNVQLWLVTSGTCAQKQLSKEQISVDENGTIRVTIPDEIPDDASYYVISVKYDTNTVKDGSGGTVVDGEEVDFTFVTTWTDLISETDSETDPDGITLAPKEFP